MRKFLVFVPEFVVVAVVAAILLFMFRPLPAKGAEFVVRPAAPERAAPKFVVRAAPAGQVVAPGPVGPVLRLFRVWDGRGNEWYEWRDAVPAPMPPPAPEVAAPRPFVRPGPTSTPTTSATTVGPVSTSSRGSTATGLIRIGARGAATLGGIRAGCATGG